MDKETTMIDQIEHIIIHTLEDTLPLLPFLFLVFLALESLEHSLGPKSQAVIRTAGKAGPLLGGLLGAVPQCGFSVVATNLFCGRVITLGTLIAVYLSTSDEMLPVALSRHASPSLILTLIAVKAVIGVIVGFCVDLLVKPQVDPDGIGAICDEEHCGCHSDSLMVSALRHTVRIFAVIFLVTLVLNGIIEIAGSDAIRRMIAGAGILSPVLASLIGLIPNCAVSVVITELYLAQTIPLGTALAGLLSGSGVAWVVLFRVNRNKRETLKIAGIVFAVSAVCGILCNALSLQL